MSAERAQRERCAQRGMSLVEVMIVLMIIGLITGLIGAHAYRSKTVAERRSAAVQISELASAVEQFMLSFHRYPAKDLQILTRPPGRGALPIVRRIPDDPWGNPYVYTNPGIHNVGWFDLSSNGPDGVPDTEDDINNWSELED